MFFVVKSYKVSLLEYRTRWSCGNGKWWENRLAKCGRAPGKKPGRVSGRRVLRVPPGAVSQREDPVLGRAAGAPAAEERHPTPTAVRGFGEPGEA